MIGPRPFMSPSWGTSINSRIYYSLLLQCLKNHTPIDTVSKKCLSTTAHLYNQQNETSSSSSSGWVFDPASGAQPAPYVQTPTLSPSGWVFDPVSGAQPVPYTQTPAPSSKIFSQSIRIEPVNPTPSSSFADVFTSVRDNTPKSIDPSLPLYDPSSTDPSKRVTIEELKLRIEYQLSRNNKSAIWRLFSSSYSENLEKQIGTPGHPFKRSILNKGSTFIQSDVIDSSEYNVISALVTSQYRRNDIIRRVEKLKKTDIMDGKAAPKENDTGASEVSESAEAEVNEVSKTTQAKANGPIRRFHFKNLKLKEFRFLGNINDEKALLSLARSVTARENIYVSEMIRLYQLTGNKDLLHHVSWTTPIIRSFVLQISSLLKLTIDSEYGDVLVSFVKQMEDLDAAYLYLTNQAEVLDPKDVTEDRLSPVYVQDFSV